MATPVSDASDSKPSTQVASISNKPDANIEIVDNSFLKQYFADKLIRKFLFDDIVMVRYMK